MDIGRNGHVREDGSLAGIGDGTVDADATFLADSHEAEGAAWCVINAGLAEFRDSGAPEGRCNRFSLDAFNGMAQEGEGYGLHFVSYRDRSGEEISFKGFSIVYITYI
ncbi:hypothetical protein NBRC3257_3014 [Gluconobacter thailandicus NBRC 3257]|uniref:Uncharacterized protein n=1 Tax=Gluconobacter thailandicus NBRC 3257 TaxID=1381097 RepID=A0ABQ0J0M4_GLUTH|nr:hypothetical protein NBRC3255_3003 [Gluconobacter thailandicus NBRC 3255]GAD28015.1 hypothetical protein NBRC3257_3014 [Gluconobacter thailandicus NBRC 3257]